MEFEHDGDVEEECYQGQGDKKDGEKEPCRNNPSNLKESLQTNEVECIFPFYYNGRKYNECVLFDESDFVFPVFRCPTRNITTKIDGVNSFTFDVGLTSGYCLSNPMDNFSTLNPSIECVDFAKRDPLSQCKNNCPGGTTKSIIKLRIL